VVLFITKGKIKGTFLTEPSFSFTRRNKKENKGKVEIFSTALKSVVYIIQPFISHCSQYL